MFFIRIRIYWISGIFRIRPARVFDGQALIRICLGGNSGYGEKRESGEVKSCKS